MIDKMREEFERWMDGEGVDDSYFDREPTGEYVEDSANSAWLAWQHKESEIKALRDEIFNTIQAYGYANIPTELLLKLRALGENSNG